MKKLTMLCAAVMLMVTGAFAQQTRGLQFKAPVKTTKSVKAGETPVNMFQDAVFYGDEYTADGSQELDMYFCTAGVTLNSDGSVSGDGYILQIYAQAATVNANLMLPDGTYQLSESPVAGTVLAGNDPYAGTANEGYYTDGSLIYTAEGGQLTGVEFITSGSMTISGTTITMNFDCGDYIYNGTLTIVDGRPSPDAPYADYEPNTPTTLNLQGSFAEITMGSELGATDDMFLLDFEATNDYHAMLLCYTGANGISGTYTVGANSADQTPGTILYSDGVSGQSISYSACFVRTDDGYVSVDDGIFFITGGSVTIEGSENGTVSSVNGTLTSYFGSTINLTYGGVGIEDAQAVDFTVTTNDKDVTIDGVANENVLIFDLQGRVIVNEKMTSNTYTMPNAGMYIVKVGKTAKKVVVE